MSRSLYHCKDGSVHTKNGKLDLKPIFKVWRSYPISALQDVDGRYHLVDLRDGPRVNDVTEELGQVDEIFLVDYVLLTRSSNKLTTMNIHSDLTLHDKIVDIFDEQITAMFQTDDTTYVSTLSKTYVKISQTFELTNIDPKHHVKNVIIAVWDIVKTPGNKTIHSSLVLMNDGSVYEYGSNKDHVLISEYFADIGFSGTAPDVGWRLFLSTNGILHLVHTYTEECVKYKYRVDKISTSAMSYENIVYAHDRNIVEGDYIELTEEPVKVILPDLVQTLESNLTQVRVTTTKGEAYYMDYELVEDGKRLRLNPTLNKIELPCLLMGVANTMKSARKC